MSKNQKYKQEVYQINFTLWEKAFIILMSLIITVNTYLCLIWHRPPSETPRETAALKDDLSHYCEVYGLDYNLMAALISVESSWNPTAVSETDCRGLMQISEPTWYEVTRKLNKDWSFSEAFEREKNLQVGCFYFAYLRDWGKHRGDVNPLETAILSYHGGMGNFRRGTIPEASFEYLDRILRKIHLQEKYSKIGEIRSVD